jgi:RNA-directed DNA polymerase
MRLTTNDNICEPAKPDATDWKSIKWYKVNRHVDSLQKRIYRASKNNDTLILLDKCILEPIVSKGTR